jgi:hypothetical protein
LVFRLTVSDGILSSQDEVVIAVEQENHAPRAHAGSPQTVSPGKLVELTGSGSEDPDGDPLSFAWTQIGSPIVLLNGANTASPSFTTPLVNGAVPLTFRLVVSDGFLASDPADVVVTVNNGPPLCGLGRAVPATIWPPNHKMIPVLIADVTDPDDGSVTIGVTGVTQDEPTSGLDDGDTAPDTVITAGQALVRAERSSTGNGRVYRIHFSASDSQGGSCIGSVAVGVPHSKRPDEPIVDDGQLYDATQQ